MGTTGSKGDQRPAGRETEPSRSEKPDSPTQLDKTAWFGGLKRSAKGFRRDNLSDWLRLSPTVACCVWPRGC